MSKTCMILAALALAGCVPGTTQGPVYITMPPPEIPAECKARCQGERAYQALETLAVMGSMAFAADGTRIGLGDLLGNSGGTGTVAAVSVQAGGFYAVQGFQAQFLSVARYVFDPADWDRSMMPYPWRWFETGYWVTE